MVLNIPAGVPAPGTLSLTLIPMTGVVNRSALKATEAAAVGALNFSCYVMSDGYGRAGEQAKTERRRICSAITYDVLGTKKVTFDAIKAIYDPQKPADVVSKLYAMVVEGTEFYLVERLGKPGTTELAATDIYDLYHVRVGNKTKLVPGDDGELEFTFEVSNLDDPTIDKAMVA